jgi:glucose-6-phosphate 1-epimerase
MQPLEQLNSRFSVPGSISFDVGEGGLTRAILKTPRSEAHIYLHGAHVTHFAKSGERPVLFMSKESLFQPDKAIRGGVPLIFPWFGARQPDPTGKSPMHGFARVAEWSVESARHDAGSTTLVLGLKSSDATRALWPHDFILRYTIMLADTLTMELLVQNTGREAFTFEEALHTYFAVADVRSISIQGLAGTSYLDKTDNLVRKVQDAAPMKITGETDRIYLATKSTCTSTDPGERRLIVVSKENSDATVVWNPWIAKAKAMADFGDEEWPAMVCIETCNVNAHAVTLAPGASHAMRAILSTQGL